MTSLQTSLPEDSMYTLEDLEKDGQGTRTPYAILPSRNLSAQTLTIAMKIGDLRRRGIVPNRDVLSQRVAEYPNRDLVEQDIAQRKLDPKHAHGLGVYFLKALLHQVKQDLIQSEQTELLPVVNQLLNHMGDQRYYSLQPITVNLRGIKRNQLVVDREQKGQTVVYLADDHMLYIIDGQHRFVAIVSVADFLDLTLTTRKYPRRPALYNIAKGQPVTNEEAVIWNMAKQLLLGSLTVALEVHIGLDVEQERQMFHDLNNLAKKVDTNVSIRFDDSNPIYTFIKDSLDRDQGAGILKAQIAEKDVKDWSRDDGSVTLKDLVAVNSVLFLNRTNSKGATPAEVELRLPVAETFWHEVSRIDGFGENQAKLKTVAAQPVVLKALAKLTFDFAFGRNADPQCQDQLLNGISEIDFSHDNPMWRYYEYDEETRAKKGLKGLSEYLPPQYDENGVPMNRDIGSYEGNVFRFGAKHNDIFPILGDMIRWKLNLPKRDRD